MLVVEAGGNGYRYEYSGYGGSGGSGELIEETLSVVAGNEYTIKVGKGGTAGSSYSYSADDYSGVAYGTAGASGEASSFDTISAKGGGRRK